MPCSIFSRARRAPRNRRGRSHFPVAIRTNAHPWGLPDLDAANQRVVDSANKVLRICITLLEACIRLGLPCWLENPAYSILWLLPELLALKELPGFQEIRFSQCQFEATAMKPTRLWLWHCREPRDERWQMCKYKRLCEEKGSWCPVMNRKHEVLSGLKKSGSAWKTSRKQQLTMFHWQKRWRLLCCETKPVVAEC